MSWVFRNGGEMHRELFLLMLFDDKNGNRCFPSSLRGKMPRDVMKFSSHYLPLSRFYQVTGSVLCSLLWLPLPISALRIRSAWGGGGGDIKRASLLHFFKKILLLLDCSWKTACYRRVKNVLIKIGYRSWHDILKIFLGVYSEVDARRSCLYSEWELNCMR